MDDIATERAKQEGGIFSTLSDFFSPSEAQAFPIGKIFKVGQKALGSLSSASKQLAGKKLQGKVIREVRKGHGDWRQIIFSDNTVLPMTKDYVHTLSRVKGTEKMLNLFEERDQSGRLQQAMKSMSYHEAYARRNPTSSLPKSSRDYTRQLHKNYLSEAQELDPTVIPDSVMVSRGSLYYSMPRDYAELLERNGILNIVKGTREQRLLKPFKKETP